jgi:hypothetical protein
MVRHPGTVIDCKIGGRHLGVAAVYHRGYQKANGCYYLFHRYVVHPMLKGIDISILTI